ncbi:alpha-1,2-mannosidase, putative [Nocardiopsis flavescens]|uniref:Alpha-1,2-mannosidase, putative n=1 Tax=Nocardiopsis flavescens TaxID=758803 RepID=A0A1M6L996_9ACTN|nr:GH92 family glycosyl hydrolase [Nocardiopsis flavescens]SHJ67752.1 alpha-1,2-mannosidase, putative [Nocardiopsis flavescens]
MFAPLRSPRPPTAVLALALGAALLAPPAAAAPVQAPAPATVTSPSRHVDPFVGTAGGGNTYPGAVRPFGMISWSPTTTPGDQTDTGAANGYHYGTTRVRGFALTHVNGAGCHPGAAGDVPIMPVTVPVDSSPSADAADEVFASDFDHARESAEPGRYTVTLDNGVRTDLAVGDRAGLGAFSFPEGEPAALLFRTSNSLNGSEDAEIRIDEESRTVSGSVLTGAFCGQRANGGENNRRSYYRLHFTARFDTAFSEVGTWEDDRLRPGTTEASGGEGYDRSARRGTGSGGYVGFPGGSDVRVRVGISYVSGENAAANLDAEVSAGDTVDAVAERARRSWDDRLGAVRVGGGTEEEYSVFYTALYHALLQPNLVSDVDGRYPGMDGEAHRVADGQGAQYTNFSGWDQYRAQIQLLALLEPEVAGDFAQSLLNFAGQNGGVWDRWVHVNGPTHVMTGDPSAATLATFVAMGADGFDTGAAYGSLRAQATEPHPDGLSDAGCPGQCEGQRPGLERYLELRYAPQDDCHCWGGAAETLEASVADGALAHWAARTGRDADAELFGARGGYWRNVFDPDEGYIRPWNADGSWSGAFDPASQHGFAQGSGATYTWMVPQDVAGLAEAMGGRERAAERLDGFFRTPDGEWSVGGGDPLRYDPTNEPGIHAPWLYNALGQLWKTQETVREIASSQYGTGPEGLPGNDDLGTMSAWYVFAALGLFPQAPGRAELLLSGPAFPYARIAPAGRPPITVAAPGAGPDAVYVHAVRLDGAAYGRSWLPESFVLEGGHLSFALSATPNTAWATGEDALPIDR